MTEAENTAGSLAPVEEIQRGWHELNLRVRQLESEKSALEQENKALRTLLERVIEHRQKSHGELVLLLSGLVSKLPISDVGIVVSRLVEHNTHVSEACAALAKGNTETVLPQLEVLKAWDQGKRDLESALAPAVEALIQLDTPLETDLLRNLVAHPDSFFSPAAVRTTRAFMKGHVLRDRIVKEFGEEALVLFNDVTTDLKLNPRPKREEIALSFKPDFEALLAQNSALAGKRDELLALYNKVKRGKAPGAHARAQRNAFLELSFLVELHHFYEHQNTEAPDVLFAQRLPALVEQLVLPSADDALEEKLIQQAERLISFVMNPDHRQMIINNVGKGGGTGRTLKYILLLRSGRPGDPRPIVQEFTKRLVPARDPSPQALASIFRFIPPDMQRLAVHTTMELEKLGKEEAVALGRAVAKELGLPALEEPAAGRKPVSVEMERAKAWGEIKDLVARRSGPAAIAAAIRDRLHTHYDSDEIKQSWIALTEVDPISLIRIFCQLPYLPDGRTDPVARTVMETYVTRLTHEKYASTYHKVLSSLKSMAKANPNSPTLINFLALVKWASTEAEARLSADIGRGKS